MPPIVGSTLRWGDLLSPRAMYEFTLADAWGALPTLFAMGGLFLLGCVIIFVVKKLLEWLLLCKQQRKKYILINQRDNQDKKTITRVWRPFSRGYYGSIVHVCLETLFFVALIIAAFFAAAAGNVNIWDSPLALSVVGIIITYIFANPLQNVGSGWGVFITNAFVYGEYWVLEGSQIEGFISYISPFNIELERINKITGGIMIHRVSMVTAFNGNWTRDVHKEIFEKHPSRDDQPPVDSSSKDEVVGGEEEDLLTESRIGQFFSYIRNEKPHIL